jgi:DNA-binding XRE family transcriptional regulator
LKIESSLKTGADIKTWRERNGYTQEALVLELQLGSRQTLVAWEKAATVSRVTQLALLALEHYPECRTVAGQRVRSGSVKQG